MGKSLANSWHFTYPQTQWWDENTAAGWASRLQGVRTCSLKGRLEEVGELAVANALSIVEQSSCPGTLAQGSRSGHGRSHAVMERHCSLPLMCGSFSHSFHKFQASLGGADASPSYASDLLVFDLSWHPDTQTPIIKQRPSFLYPRAKDITCYLYIKIQISQ